MRRNSLKVLAAWFQVKLETRQKRRNDFAAADIQWPELERTLEV